MEPKIPLDFLSISRSKGYGTRRLPCEQDEAIRRLIRQVRGPHDYSDVVSSIPADAWIVLATFAERMASLAVRHQDARDVEDGLVAAQLALSLTDEPREVLPVLSLLYRACEMVGAQADAEFASAASLTGADRKGPLASYPDRGHDDRTIEAMGFQEGNDEVGFRFIRTW